MALKRLVRAAFFLFAGAVAGVALFSRGNPRPAVDRVRSVTPEEITRHATARDCWMAIDGSAYDATAYLPEHPAPPEVLLPWCGRDASEAYATKGGGGRHSGRADALLANLKIGTVRALP